MKARLSLLLVFVLLSFLEHIGWVPFTGEMLTRACFLEQALNLKDGVVFIVPRD
jgi:hypothetical protein